jgi:hypothetical protein
MGLNPNYAAVSGRQQVTGRWAITLPGEFNRREEEAGLCFWRPGLTIWLTAYGTEDGMSVEERMRRDLQGAPSAATEIQQAMEGGIGRLTYCLSETRADGVIVDAVYAFAHIPDGQVMLAMYFDEAEGREMAMKVAASVEAISLPA